jgi:hypothetical protein
VRRWIALLLEGTRAVVAFGGCLSRAFPVRAGVAQGSPLSPLLYVIVAQPLAAALRGLAAAGRITPIRLRRKHLVSSLCALYGLVPAYFGLSPTSLAGTLR